MEGSPAQVPAFRRNGKRPSCEPCRKSKYRCDHRQPICERCERRGISTKCLYHPSPMKGFRPKRKPDLPTPTATTVSESGPSHETPDQDSGHGQDDTFLGSTAFNAPFTDNPGHLPTSDDESDTSPEFGRKLHEQITAKHKGNYQLETRIKQAISVMNFMKEFPLLSALVEDRDDLTPECGILTEWLDPCIRTIHDDIWVNGTLNTEGRMTEKIKELFQNTAHPVKLGAATRFEHVMPQFSGAKIRWETLALFLTVCGLCLCTVPCNSKKLKFVGGTEAGRQELMYRIHETSNACVLFCDELGCANEVYLATLIEHSVLASQVLGDTHHLVYSKLGEVSTAVFAQGLHLPERSKNLPFWLREMRLRCFGLAYALDKVVSCFLGRPPRIAKRYCQIELPLDLEWSELALEEQELAKTISRISPSGWHEKTLTGEAREWGYLRPFVINGLLREDVLEICLGPPSKDFKEIALDFIRRNTETYNALPHAISTPPGQWLEKPPTLLQCHLSKDFKYNEFLVRRAMVRHLGEGAEELLHLAHTLLLSVNETNSIGRRLGSSIFESQWHAAFYGLPTAGVLALELLQQNFKSICHSYVAQNICVFISILRWLHTPGDGNYQLIDRARRTLQSIVDKYMGGLCRSSGPGKGMHTDSTALDLSVPDSTEMLLSDTYDFNWLDNEMFDQNFWSNFEPYETMPG